VFLLMAALLAAASWVLERAVAFGLQGTDDANIFFRYARNLLDGHGLVYNAGGEPVEGYTSTLWLVVVTYAHLLGARAPHVLWATSLLLAAGTMTLIAWHSSKSLSRFLPRPVLGPVTLLVGAAALSHPAWMVWNVTSLMDTGLYTFCLTLAWVALDRLRAGRSDAPRWSVIAASALVLCRPEGLGWVVVLLVLVAAMGYFRVVPRPSMRAALRSLALSSALVAAALLAFRWLTFGALLPNPLYAKVSAPLGDRLRAGLLHLLTYLEVQPVLLVACALVPVLGQWLVRARLSRARRRSLLAAWVTPWVMVLSAWVVPVVAGGDVFGGHRFFQPVFLLLAVPLAVGLGMCLRGLRRSVSLWAGSGVVVGALAFGLWGHFRCFVDSNTTGRAPRELSEHIASEFWIAREDRLHGARLAEVFMGHLPRIAFAAAGGISVGYPGVVLDMMGLNDSITAHRCSQRSGPIGHACFDRERFFELLPDALLPRGVAAGKLVDLARVEAQLNNPRGWDYTIFRGLFADPAFRSRYRLVRVTRRGVAASAYGYFSVPFLMQLSADPTFELEVAP